MQTEHQLTSGMHGLPMWAQRVTIRPPDLCIGESHDPYLLRWYVIPRNPVFNVYLHKFLRSDDDRALHDHPWLFFISVILKGAYNEQTISPGGTHHRRYRSAGSIAARRWGSPHRVEMIDTAFGPASCWTLFITGPRVRTWGFHCPTKWVPWHVFLSNTPGRSVTGRGCGD